MALAGSQSKSQIAQTSRPDSSFSALPAPPSPTRPTFRRSATYWRDWPSSINLRERSISSADGFGFRTTWPYHRKRGSGWRARDQGEDLGTER